MDTLDDGLSVWPKRAYGVDTGRHFLVVMHGLGIVSRKNDLCARKLGETHTCPIRAALAGIVWA